ncbi:MAG: HEAT repeat domain-containing protein [Chloroflexota bacterium]
MKALERLFAVLDVQQGERQPVVLMWGYSFCLGVAASTLLAASNALFLETFGSAGLPWLYMAIAVVMGLTAYGYLKLEERLAFEQLIPVVLGLLAVLVVLARLGLWLLPGRWLLFALPLLLPASSGLGGLIFWGLAGRLFDLRQGKRLYGVIGTGRWLAAVLLGFAVSLLVRQIGTENLLLVAAAGLLGNLWLATHALKRSRTQAATSPTRPSISRPDGPAPAARSDGYERRYPLMMGLWMVASSVGYYVAEFVFNDRVAAQFADVAQLAGFLGVFSALEGLLNLVVGALVTGPFIARLGILAGVLVNPAALFACTLVMFAVTSLWGTGSLFGFAAFTYLLMIVINSSIDRPSFSILYQPIPIARRGRVQTVVEGIVQQAAMGLIGLVLLFVALFEVTLPGLLAILTLSAAAWAWVAWQLGGREYPRVLQKALARRALDGLDNSLIDADSVALLQQGLNHPHPAAVLYALHTLEQIDTQQAIEALPGLLQHDDAQVRLAAWTAVERIRPPAFAALAAERLAHERQPDVLGAGLRALACVDGHYGFQMAQGYLESCQPETRLGALVALVRYGGIEGVLAAGQVLLRLVESPDAGERALAATALGEIGVQTFYQPLLPLLRDQALEVRRAALRSTGKLNAPELWPLVVQAVYQRGTRRPAQQALVAAGPPCWDALQSALDGQRSSPETLCRLLSAVGLVGGEQAVSFLVRHVCDENVCVRTEVLQQLFHLGYRADAEDAPTLRRQIYAEAERAAWLLASWQDTGDGPGAMLRSAYLNCLAQLRLRLLNLLSFLYDLQTIRRIRYNLIFGSPAERAVALEVIETLVGREVGAYVLPVLDDLPAELALARLGAAFSQKRLRRNKRLGELLAQAGHALTPWAGACALYTVGKERLQDLSQPARACLDSPDALLREMAAWALYQLDAFSDSRRTDPAHDSAPAVQAAIHPGGKPMLSTVEKVIFLKTVSSFAAMPDDALADVALLLDEQEAIAGERIIEKGEAGDSMYIVVDGRVRVHNDHVTLNYLGAGDVFGELAVLASEPRSASVTAEEDALLLRLEQYELYELMEYRSEVAHGIIQVLTRHLRARTRELADLRRDVERMVPL